MSLGLSQSLVFQSGDTLKFFEHDSLVLQWILKNEEYGENSGYSVEKAKVSEDHRKFFLYEEGYFFHKDNIFTRVTLYDSKRTKLWSIEESSPRKISFELSRIYPDKTILFTTERTNTSPQMLIIKDNHKETIDLKQWTSISNYEISPNNRYVLFHARRPYNNRLWDYIYFFDVKTNKDWEYLFPICFSCKRGWLDLKIDDEGKSEVVYKNEHRIFDKEGNLVDVFVKLD
ncbi:MAG: hypothetical protein ACUVQT_02960 [bacterium]